MSLLKKIFIFTGTLLALILLFLVSTILMLLYGPSVTARNLFVNSAMESSAGKFLATTFLSKKKVKEILESNSVTVSEDVTDLNSIDFNDNDIDKDKIEIIELNGSTYHGYLAIINDPSRVMVGVSGKYGSGQSGKRVNEIAESYNAVLAINGGGFEDANGMGTGGTPIGAVISEGKLLYDSRSTTYPLIGFDNENKLFVGNITGKQAIDMGIRDALAFGPILIVNGVPSQINGTGGGLNPRTAIGQRADGAVLMLAIEGRQANSLGASQADLQNIFLEYGAVNAANLDGGSSTLMYYKGEYINHCASLYGPRKMPTTFIVK